MQIVFLELFKRSINLRCYGKQKNIIAKCKLSYTLGNLFKFRTHLGSRQAGFVPVQALGTAVRGPGPGTDQVPRYPVKVPRYQKKEYLAVLFRYFRYFSGTSYFRTFTKTPYTVSYRYGDHSKSECLYSCLLYTSPSPRDRG